VVQRNMCNMEARHRTASCITQSRRRRGKNHLPLLAIESTPRAGDGAGASTDEAMKPPDDELFGLSLPTPSMRAERPYMSVIVVLSCRY
jgi:hypothetical protein